MIKKNKKILSIVITSVLILIGILFVFGIIDLSLYKANFQDNSVGSIAYSKSQGRHSYDIKVQYHGETICNQKFIGSNGDPIQVVAKIDDYKYKGNYYCPLYKNFTLDYKCDFSCPTSNENGIKKFNGSIKGSIKCNIVGLCSIRKTKKVSEEKALQSIKKYIMDSVQRLDEGK